MISERIKPGLRIVTHKVKQGFFLTSTRFNTIFADCRGGIRILKSFFFFLLTRQKYNFLTRPTQTSIISRGQVKRKPFLRTAFRCENVTTSTYTSVEPIFEIAFTNLNMVFFLKRCEHLYTEPFKCVYGKLERCSRRVPVMYEKYYEKYRHLHEITG